MGVHTCDRKAHMSPWYQHRLIAVSRVMKKERNQHSLACGHMWRERDPEKDLS